MNNIRIEQPCHENWNSMHAHADGRWCMLCSKTVVDFTKMNDKQVMEFLKDKNGEQVCGRCRTDQVISPEKKSSRFRWLATAASFFFGISLLSSCYRHVQGCVAYVNDPPPDKKHKQEIKPDSVHANHFKK